jgi:TP53 regulating kinase-like protein
MKPTIIQQGAEAIILKKENLIIKDRIKKKYRLDELDKKIRKRRTKKEAKIIEKLKNIISVPKIKEVKEKEIIMQFISGKKLSEHLDKLKNKEKIAEEIGETTAILHNNNIIHGDLTTSNMILHGNKVYFIDFGLGFHSSRIEDKAVDLHLLRQALEAKHWKNWEKLFKCVLRGYKSKEKAKILEQLKKVEARGRYKKWGAIY